MNILLALNYKLFETQPDILVKKIENIKEISGFEIFIDINKKIEKDYLSRMAYLCKEKNLILQIHSSITIDEEINEHLDFYNEISKIYDKPINIVNHPFKSDSIYIAQEKTNILFSKILNYIYEKQYRLNYSIENLNSEQGDMRLSKKYLIPILSNNQDLYFTYDIGHEIMEYGEIVDLREIFIDRLINIHLHTFDYLNEHKPITKNDVYKSKWVKAINYLKQIGYNGNIVLEYDVNLLGTNFDEKINNYIEAAKFMYQYAGGNL